MLIDEIPAHCFVSSHGLVVFSDNSFVIRKINFGVIDNFVRSNNFVEQVVSVYKAITQVCGPLGVSSGARVEGLKSRIACHADF